MAPFLPPLDPRRVAAGVLCTVVVAVGGWWLLRPPPAPIEQVLPRAGLASVSGPGSSLPAPVSGTGAGPIPTSTTIEVAPELVVQAAGAVRSPGVYRLPAGARVDDLVTEAGGFGPGADPDRVNLAAPLVDGERVWIPAAGEWAAPEVLAGGVGGAGSASGSQAGGADDDDDAAGAGPDEPLDLNRADADDLEELPGVGPATAEAILAHREENGPFASVDALLDVRGIGEAKLEAIRPLVKVGP